MTRTIALIAALGLAAWLLVGCGPAVRKNPNAQVEVLYTSGLRDTVPGDSWRWWADQVTIGFTFTTAQGDFLDETASVRAAAVARIRRIR